MFGGGCAGLGAVYMQSDDPATRAWGTLMHNEGSHEQRMEESAAGRSEVNVYTNMPRQKDKTVGATWSQIRNLDNGNEWVIQGRSGWTKIANKNDKEKFPKKGYFVLEVIEGVPYRELWLEKLKDNRGIYIVHEWEEYQEKD